MTLIFIITSSIVLQLITAGLAARFALAPGRRTFGAVVFVLSMLMASRRGLSLYHLHTGASAYTPDLFSEAIGLLISALLLSGVIWLVRVLRAREESEQSLQHRTRELAKRVKELDCLYALACLSERPGVTVPALLSGLTEILPTALEHPEHVLVRISLDGKEYKTPGWERSPREHLENIVVDGKMRGRISVCYRAGAAQDCPFLEEEKRLFNMIATRVGRLLEQIQARASIQRERDFAESLIETAHAIVLVLDTEGRIVRFNRYLEEVAGYTLPEVAGRNWFEVFSPERDQARMRSIFARAVKDARIDCVVEPLISKSGRRREIEWYARTLRDAEGNFLGLLAVGHDITDRKQAERDMKLREQQLAQADKMASLGVLVSGVAHEINNPNHFVMMSMSMLAKAWHDAEPILEQYYQENGDFLMGGLNYTEARQKVPVMITRVMEGSDRIRSIVQELRDFARQPTSELMEVVDVNEVVRSTMILLSNMLKRSVERLTVQFADDIPGVRGNFRRLEQVVVNLVQNACQALPDRDRGITLATTFDRSAGTVTVLVRDEGVGIPEENLARIMDPFFTTKRDTGGTGLGLSIASTIVKEHGGTLSLLSEVGKGTTATLVLPAIP